MADSLGSSTFIPTDTSASWSAKSSSSTPAPLPLANTTNAYLDDKNLLCEWLFTATNCREERITQNILIASSILHSIVAVYAIWLIIERSGGVNRKIFTGLFTAVGNRVQPRPTRWVVLCFIIACVPRLISNMILVFDVLRGSLWVRVLLDQLYWATIAVLGVMYIVGLLYTIPITRRVGSTGTFEPEHADGCDHHEPVALIYPAPLQINIFIALSVFTILAFAVGPAIVSALLYSRGEFETSNAWLTTRHAVWSWIFFVLVIVFLYYGIKFTRILKMNIIIAETRLGMPYTRFGLTNLVSKSPARYLFIMQQITVFGAVAIANVIVLIATSFLIFRTKILTAKLGHVSHCYAFAWTCALPFAAVVKLLLVHVQLIRNTRMRQRLTGLYWPNDDTENRLGLETDLNLAKDPGAGGPGGTREIDLRFLALDCEIENMASKTIIWTSNHNASSSSSDPISSAVGEYIRDFSLGGGSTLPTGAALSSRIHCVPSKIHCDAQAQACLMTAHFGNGLSNYGDPVASAARGGICTCQAQAHSPSVIIYDSSQKAFLNLGRFQG